MIKPIAQPTIAEMVEQLRQALEEAEKLGLDVTFQDNRFQGPLEQASGEGGQPVMVRRRTSYRAFVILIGV
jgi:hypothetical protein